jgi:hypothetical protein
LEGDKAEHREAMLKLKCIINEKNKEIGNILAGKSTSDDVTKLSCELDVDTENLQSMEKKTITLSSQRKKNQTNVRV